MSKSNCIYVLLDSDGNPVKGSKIFNTREEARKVKTSNTRICRFNFADGEYVR